MYIVHACMPFHVVPIVNFFIPYAGCQPRYVDGMLWDRHKTGEQARIRCSRLHKNFRPGVYITSTCSDNKEWSDVHYSSCTMRQDANPLIIIEIYGGVNISALSAASKVSTTNV